MHRRDFLRTGAQAAVVSSVLSAAPVTSSAAVSSASAADTPAILNRYTAEDHRRRLRTSASRERAIRTCLRKHLITNYLPAQCCYNLGEYPCRQPWDPGRIRRAGTGPAARTTASS